MIDEKKLIEEIQDHIEKGRTKCNQMVELGLDESVVKYNHGEYCYVNALHLVQTQPKVGEWIPFEMREADEEDKETYGDVLYMLCGRLPEENQEILVSYSCGVVATDTFLRDGFECYLDSNADFVEEAIAWMPLPEPYRKDVE